MNTTQRIQKHIMRRIYYTYVLRLVVHPRTMHAAGALALILVFTSLVSVGDVLYNFSFIPVYQIDSFVLMALKNTDVWTLLTLLGFVVLGVSYIRTARIPRSPGRFNFA